MAKKPAKTVTPRVSVVMPAYKCAGFMQRAVASVQAQTLEDWELIIVNDASPDDTAKVAAKFAKADPRIQLISLPQNGGASVARNAGFAAATGTWIAIIDADDAYTPDRLQRLVEHAEAHDLDLVADNQQLYDAGAGRVLRQGFVLRDGKPLVWDLSAHFTLDRPNAGYFLGWSKILLRNDFYRRSGLSYRPEARYGQDYLFYGELLAHGARAEIIDNPGYIYTLPRSEVLRSHSGQSVSKPDMPLMVKSSQWFIETYFDTMTPAERRLARERQQEMEDAIVVANVLDLLRQRHVMKAIFTLLRHPGMLGRRQLWYCMYLMVARRVLKLPRGVSVWR